MGHWAPPGALGTPRGQVAALRGQDPGGRAATAPLVPGASRAPALGPSSPDRAAQVSQGRCRGCRCQECRCQECRCQEGRCWGCRCRGAGVRDAGVGGAGVRRAGVGGAGVGDAGVGAGVEDAGVGGAGVGAGVRGAGVGGGCQEGGCQEGGCRGAVWGDGVAGPRGLQPHLLLVFLPPAEPSQAPIWNDGPGTSGPRYLRLPCALFVSHRGAAADRAAGTPAPPRPSQQPPPEPAAASSDPHGSAGASRPRSRASTRDGGTRRPRLGARGTPTSVQAAPRAPGPPETRVPP
ncbi:hypothetical protein VULLAG_LOCUS8637 [Vulpes lagopus]